jgi:hypothetical protein
MAFRDLKIGTKRAEASGTRISVSTAIQAFRTEGVSPHREGSIAASQKIVNCRESRPMIVCARPNPEGVEMRHDIIYSQSVGPDYVIHKSNDA